MNNLEKIVFELQEKIEVITVERNEYVKLKTKMELESNKNIQKINAKISELNDRLIRYKQIKEKIRILFENNLSELVDNLNSLYDQELGNDEIFDMILNIDEKPKQEKIYSYQFSLRDIK